MGKDNRTIGVTLLLALGLALPATGFAAAPSQFEDHSIRVNYADLDIQSDAGAAILYARLKRASQRVCDVDSYWTHGSVARFLEARQCSDEVLSNAVNGIDSKALKKIHAS